MRRIRRSFLIRFLIINLFLIEINGCMHDYSSDSDPELNNVINNYRKNSHLDKKNFVGHPGIVDSKSLARKDGNRSVNSAPPSTVSIEREYFKPLKRRFSQNSSATRRLKRYSQNSSAPFDPFHSDRLSTPKTKIENNSVRTNRNATTQASKKINDVVSIGDTLPPATPETIENITLAVTPDVTLIADIPTPISTPISSISFNDLMSPKTGEIDSINIIHEDEMTNITSEYNLNTADRTVDGAVAGLPKAIDVNIEINVNEKEGVEKNETDNDEDSESNDESDFDPIDLITTQLIELPKSKPLIEENNLNQSPSTKPSTTITEPFKEKVPISSVGIITSGGDYSISNISDSIMDVVTDEDENDTDIEIYGDNTVKEDIIPDKIDQNEEKLLLVDDTKKNEPKPDNNGSLLIESNIHTTPGLDSILISVVLKKEEKEEEEMEEYLIDDAIETESMRLTLQITQQVLLFLAGLTFLSILVYSIYYVNLIRKIYSKTRISE